ncbi:MAG: hypothetical protein J7M21_00360 [Planctomycetes bacterium]|nr:hypothetical protein [Planctomycetota bacterium]
MKHFSTTTAGLLLAVLAAGCGAQQTLLGARSSYLLTVTDVLSRPGEPVELKARLREGDFLRGAAGCAVWFYRQGRLFKVAETDSQGLATVTFTPPRDGDYVFSVAVAPIGLADEPPAPRELLVACRRADTPIVVVDLDGTIVAGGFQAVLVGRPEPMSGSQEVLKRLARTHTIIYLTHRPDFFSIKTKAWLRQHDYPPGPILLSTLEGFLRGSEQFKGTMLAALRRRFSRMEVGIGDKISDARAYADNGLRAILLLNLPGGADASTYDALADELNRLDEKTQVAAG